jgi:glutathione peroxidase
MSVYDFNASTRTNEVVPLSDYKGKVMLIVNTASRCAFTPQFKGLEWLNQRYKDKGLQVLGFPCNQFARQDPADNIAIAGFCKKNYGVSFPMFCKIDVNGRDAHPLYRHLKESARGAFWSKRIKWNFTKFLVDQNGNVLHRYAPFTKPSKLVGDIEKALSSRA